eukprot:Em0001g958a
MAVQQLPPKTINELDIDAIADYMWIQFDPTRVHSELTARIAVTCDFTAIKDPLDEAMRTRFMCSINNEAVLKVLFKVKDSELTFAKAITVAVESIEAAKVAKETVHGSTGRQTEVVNRVQDKPTSFSSAESLRSNGCRKTDFPKRTCPRCGSREHAAGNCPFKETICLYCQKAGHLQSVCLKRKNSQLVNIITKKFRTIKAISSTPLQQSVKIEDQYFNFEVSLQAKDSGAAKAENVSFTVTKVPGLNLLGQDAIIRVGGGSTFQHFLEFLLLIGWMATRWCNQSLLSRISNQTPLFKKHVEPHRYPMPLPEDLMRKLSGGYGFTKIDLADAYNQIMLGPESQKRLALSTHRGVLLQRRLPFGISSAPAHFQEIKDQLTSDLKGVAVYVDILVSGASAAEHLDNLHALLQRLQDKGLRCRKEKCLFAQASIEYLGYTLSSNGIAKGSKVDAVQLMPAPSDISSLRFFL